MTKIDIQKLNRYQDEGWVKSQSHPRHPLLIWNYTQATSFERKWDEITLLCRGLVTDTEGNIIARPINKFFNYEELLAENSVPKGPYTIYEKMDGSYIQVFNYKGLRIVSSRGSFTSDQAMYATDIIADKWGNLQKNTILTNPNYNFIFELIHPDNRIVVDYKGAKDLVLLSVIRKDGKWLYPDHFQDIYPVVESYGHDERDIYSGLKRRIADDKEGFVLLYDSGERMKIKGEEYCRLHQIVTNTSSKDIWTALKDGASMSDFVDNVPDEFMDWFYQKVGEYTVKFKLIEEECKTFVEKDLQVYKDLDGNLDKKYAAEIVLEHRYKSVIFAMVDGKNYNEIIWRIIKPEFEKAFSI